MRQKVRTALFFVPLFLLVPLLLVYSLAPLVPALSQTTKPKTGGAQQKVPPLQIHYGTEDLPGPVREMREMLLSAIQSGKIEDLRPAYELNDLKPDLGPNAKGDPVAHWKKTSGDGEGREILAALSLILEAGYVVLPLGRDLENNRLYIWPYFAEIPVDRITPAQEVELLRLVPPAAAKDMKAKGRYSHWRTAIGADGAWHAFRRDD